MTEDITNKKRPEYKKKRVILPSIIAIIMLTLGIIGAIHSTYYQSTDDAFVEGRLISIAPRVSGPVVKLLVDDNNEVKEGQLLLEIDSKDYEVRLHQAEAKLAQAKALLKMTQKEVETGQSNLNQSYQDVTSAYSKLDFAQKDYKRYKDMYKEGIASKQEYDNSKTNLTVAKSNHKGATDRTKAMKSQLESHQAKTESFGADIQRLEAEVEQAKLDLSYTKIYAPQSGMVSARSVEKGNYVQIGQPLMQIVPKKVWVIANFKEIQLTNMKQGQPVTLKVDTYPNKKFKGRIDSIQRATGAKSSLFPPENAVGSYVKIVQRVPVKIIFEEDISNYNIVPGMSVVPKVKVKGKGVN
ncbi:MAG: HlyD family secretion protein [Candidatus Gastranaerophilaceae bacterium]